MNCNYIPQMFDGTHDYGRIIGCVIDRNNNYINKMYIKVEIENRVKSSSVLSIDNMQLIISGIVVENINARFDSYFIGDNTIHIPINLKESIPIYEGSVQIKVKLTDDEDKCGEIIDAELYVDYKELKSGEEIKEFNLNKMLPYSVVSCIGNRRCGKSWLIRDIMSNSSKKMLPVGYLRKELVEGDDPFYNNFFPKSIKLEKLNFNRVILDLKETGKNIEKEKSTVLVIEDCIPSDYWKSTVFKNLVINSYHYNLMVIMSIQSVKDIPPPLRENIGYLFLFASHGSNLKKIWEIVASVVPSFELFKTIFYKYTRDYGCLVVDKTSTSSRLDDNIFYYKAKDPGEFTFGE
jgi:hypothetical protein